MVSEIDETKFSQAEYERAYDAYGEWKQNGKTNLICAHCRKGQFQFIERGSSAEIRCETPKEPLIYS